MITFAKLVSPSQYKSKRKEIEEEKEVKIFLKVFKTQWNLIIYKFEACCEWMYPKI